MNEPLTNAFTVDVEDYFQVEGFADVIDRASWNKYESRVENNTDAILALLDVHGVKGTFFVLGWIAERHPNLIKRISEAGHEIASHGYSHRLVYKQTPDTFREETRRSKALLEDLCQKPVVGYRAATYSITVRSLWALDILSEEGFSYDSSIFPIKHDRYGMVDMPRFPYYFDCQNGGSLIEFPISTYKLFGHNMPIGGGGYFRLFPLPITVHALSHINETEHEPFIFYLHPWEIDPGQPEIKEGRLLSRFRHRVNLDSCGEKLDKLLRSFAFTTVSGVLDSHSRNQRISAHYALSK